jgi:hypothetical protein
MFRRFAAAVATEKATARQDQTEQTSTDDGGLEPSPRRLERAGLGHELPPLRHCNNLLHGVAENAFFVA